MNSKQRRQERRRWIYEIDSPSHEYDDYIKKFEWCSKMFGSTVADGWRNKSGTFGDTWQFDCDKKATLFALRWKTSAETFDW